MPIKKQTNKQQSIKHFACLWFIKMHLYLYVIPILICVMNKEVKHCYCKIIENY